MDLLQLALGGNSTGSGVSIPGLDNIQNMLGIITIVSAVLGILFLVVYIFGLLHRVRSERAMITMQKDIAAIKEILAKQANPATTPPVQTQQIVEPPAPGLPVEQ